MSQNFWDAFWANLLSNLTVVIILSALGYIAKAKIARDLKKFIANEIDEAVKQIKSANRNYKWRLSPLRNLLNCHEATTISKDRHMRLDTQCRKPDFNDEAAAGKISVIAAVSKSYKFFKNLKEL